MPASPSPRQIIVDAISRRMSALGLRQSDLARALQLEPDKVSKIFSGRRSITAEEMQEAQAWLARAEAAAGAAPGATFPEEDASVAVRLLPTWVGLGDGGTGDGEEVTVRFSRDLVERELRADPSKLLAMVAEGNSMEPAFRGGDHILVDTRRTSLAQPGAYCIWDGDGHVIKYLERLADSDPPMVRVIPANPIYQTREVALDEVRIIGRVVWYGRRVQ